MSERLILKGALGEKKLASNKLAVTAEGIIRSLKMIIQPASITKLEDLKTAEAVQLTAELHLIRSHYMDLKKEIAEIEKELNG